MLHYVDFIIIALYLAGTITVGIVFRGRQQNAGDYFTAGRGMKSVFQSLMVGLSIAAALFSGVSFLSYPSVVYSHGIMIILALITFPICWLVLRFWFLPRFLRADVKYPYDIIEQKLGPNIRTLAAGTYMLLRIGWMATLIYAPTIAILAAANLSDNWFWPVVLTIGLTCTSYTTFGGIRGLIITDAIQFVVIVLGILITCCFILYRLPVSFSEMFADLRSSGALTLFDFSPAPTKMLTFWSIIIGVTAANVCTYTADQMSLQRYLAAGSRRSADRSFAFNTIGAMVVVTLLVLVGIAVRSWYHYVPDPALPQMADKVFPYFIASQLPGGIAGLVLAALLAATVTSMNGGINALAATATIDFRMRLGKKLTPHGELRFGRIVSMIIGLAATLAAGLVGFFGTIFDISLTVLGLFLGPLFLCIFFSVTDIPVNRKSLAVGMITGVFAGGMAVRLSWSSLWVTPVTLLTGFALTLIGTFIFGPDKPAV